MPNLSKKVAPQARHFFNPGPGRNEIDTKKGSNGKFFVEWDPSPISKEVEHKEYKRFFFYKRQLFYNPFCTHYVNIFMYRYTNIHIVSYSMVILQIMNFTELVTKYKIFLIKIQELFVLKKLKVFPSCMYKS